MVHFMAGKKHPILIIDGYEFIIQRRRGASHVWMCSCHSKYKCKVRLQTTSSMITIKRVSHSHGRTFKGSYENLQSQWVHVTYVNKLDSTLPVPFVSVWILTNKRQLFVISTLCNSLALQKLFKCKQKTQNLHNIFIL